MDAQMQQQMQIPASFSGAPGFDQTGKVLYVGNITPKINEAILWEVFNAVGGVETLKILRDKTTGESMGYGFVDFLNADAATRALTQLNGVDVYGSKLKVNWAIHGTSQREDTSGYSRDEWCLARPEGYSSQLG